MSCKIYIIGLGYVDLSLAHAFTSRFKAITKGQYEELSASEVIIDVNRVTTNPIWKL